MDIKELISEIKKSKKYRNISEEVIGGNINSYIKKNPHYDEKLIIKGVKTLLHNIHGSFQVSVKKSKKREEYLHELEKNPKDIELIKKILDTNRSTKERLPIYSELYGTIFDITGKPRNIMDLGCGLNPVSFPFMAIYPEHYYCYDINESDTIFLNKFFKTAKAFGIAETLDLTNIENVKKLPGNIDVCFMFKLLDTLEKSGHKYSEEIIHVLLEKCKFVVVSFATRTLGGRKMTFAERGWIQRMLARIGMKFQKIDFEEAGEIFYIISKS